MNRSSAKRDRCTLIFGGGDLIDVVEFGLAFDVERVNLLVEGIFDLFARFPNAGEGAFRRGAAGLQDAEKFAAGNDVETGAGIREQF